LEKVTAKSSKPPENRSYPTWTTGLRQGGTGVPPVLAPHRPEACATNRACTQPNQAVLWIDVAAPAGITNSDLRNFGFQYHWSFPPRRNRPKASRNRSRSDWNEARSNCFWNKNSCRKNKNNCRRNKNSCRRNYSYQFFFKLIKTPRF